MNTAMDRSLVRTDRLLKRLNWRRGIPLAFVGVVTATFIEDLHQAAPLHDVGKIAIPDEILNKPGRLTDEEFQIMRRTRRSGGTR